MIPRTSEDFKQSRTEIGQAKGFGSVRGPMAVNGCVDLERGGHAWWDYRL
ncbi:MAG TPA: hypothetical protein P5159_17305 [Phycisphaerae bacterium]|nr:hypothetical protein [Phycisphaerae bacterium]